MYERAPRVQAASGAPRRTRAFAGIYGKFTRPCPRSRSEVDVVLLDGLIDTRAEPLHQVVDDGRLVFGIVAGPGARFHLDEPCLIRPVEQAIEVHVELHAAVGD